MNKMVRCVELKSSIPAMSRRCKRLIHVQASQVDDLSSENGSLLDVKNVGTLDSIAASLQQYINSESPSRGRKLHSTILKTGFRPNVNIGIKLLILHLKCGCVRYAGQVFDEISSPTMSAYNYMVNGYIKNGMALEALDMVRNMAVSGSRPDGFTFSMVLKAASNEKGGIQVHCGGLAKQVHGQILRSEIMPDDVLYSALVDSYVKGGKMSYARRVFDTGWEKDVTCSTSLISGYMDQGMLEEAERIFGKTAEKDVVVFNAMIEGYSKRVGTAIRALNFFIDMLRLGFRPTISTFASVIGACSSLASFEVGQQVQGQLIKVNLFKDIKMGSALLDMFSKCGRIEDARQVFDQMCHRNVYTWTSIIDGYGRNGDPNVALELFNKMQKEHLIAPNDVTFLSALSACGHAGLVSTGMDIFESMKRDYMMIPGMEHYACLVDLIGRAGSLNQAWNLVNSMPEKPNADVWAALLSSCRLHGNVVMADIAANELFELNSDGRPGAYVAFSNALAENGKWDNVIELRDLMKVKRIATNNGRSWVSDDNIL